MVPTVGFIAAVLVTLGSVLSANYGPVFDDMGEEIDVIVGRTAELPCSAKHKGQHMIIWVNPKGILITKGDVKVVEDKRISVNRESAGDWNLRIEHVRYNDTGEYMCQINTSPAKIKRVFLNVQVPPHILRTESSGDLDIEELETVKLTCKATGVPQPTITWYKRSLTSADSKDNLNKHGETLILENIKRFESGVYICKADNGVPIPAWRQMEIKVQYAPVVRVLNSRIGQMLRRETVLECTVTSYPRSKITWFKNGREVHHSYRYRIELYDGKFDTWSLSLQILNINESDYGDYVCEAKNIMGEDRAVTALYEYREYTTSTEPPATFYPFVTTPYDEYWFYESVNGPNHVEIYDQYVVLADGKTIPIDQYKGTFVGRQGSQNYGQSIGDDGGSGVILRSDLLLQILCINALVFSL